MPVLLLLLFGVVEASPSGNPDSQMDYSRRKSQRFIVFASGLFLFLAGALVVVWQNSRLAVLWDLSYILENAYRISIGQIPYRDFPLAHSPLTFIIQAAIIRFTGRAYWHTTVYCAVMNGLSSILTWRILFYVLRDRISHARLLAFILSLPLIPLGVYSVFPHPFYDPDCTLIILIALLLLHRVDFQVSSLLRPVLAGIALVIPVFVKQNTGLAFLGTVVLGLVVLVLIEAWRKRSTRRHVSVLLAALLAVSVMLAVIQLTAGLNNYWHWTVQYAAARRTPARSEMLEIYWDKMLLLWIAIFVLGLFVGRLNSKRSGWLAALSGSLMSAPFVWPTVYLLFDHDASERADRLLILWPLVLIISFILAIVTVKQRRELGLILPFVLIATVNGAFMSQQLWGSTYAIWPLFMILTAQVLVSLSDLWRDRPRMMLPVAAIIVLSLLISGACYVRSHERLDYANLDEGALTRSSLPPLKGLATRGDWLPNLEELVRYTDREIPREDGILIIPNEDLFYYTTGRRPLFPVVVFDHTVNPYSPEEIVKVARDRNIRWLIVKQDLQNEDEDLEKQRDQLTEALEGDFEQVESLKNYDIYRRSDEDQTGDK
jgi:hypothetical protein